MNNEAERFEAVAHETSWLQSLVTKQTVFVAVLVLVISQALSWVGFFFARDALRERVHDHLDAVAMERLKRLDTFVSQQHERVALVASRTRLRQLIAQHTVNKVVDERFLDETQRILQDAKKSTQGFLGIWFANVEGRVITATDPEYLDRQFGDEVTFREGLKHQHLGIPYVASEKFQALLSAPATSSDGTLLGVVMVLADMRPLVNLLSDRTGLGRTGEVLVGTLEDGEVQFLLPPRQSDVTTSQAEVGPLVKAIHGDDGFEITEFSGRNALVRYLPAGYHSRDFRPWGLAAKMDVAEAYAPWCGCETSSSACSSRFWPWGCWSPTCSSGERCSLFAGWRMPPRGLLAVI